MDERRRGTECAWHSFRFDMIEFETKICRFKTFSVKSTYLNFGVKLFNVAKTNDGGKCAQRWA